MRDEEGVGVGEVKQKVSGAFYTHRGADTCCFAIRSCISAARKHGHNVIDAMYDAFMGQPFVSSGEMAK